MDQEQIIRDLTKQIEDLTRTVEGIQRDLGSHTHGGNDKSSSIYNDGVALKPGQGLQAGRVALVDGIESGSIALQRILGAVIIGEDGNSVDGSDNAQLTFEHQIGTTGTTNQTFMYGLRPPFYIGLDGVVASGKSTLTTKSYSFPRDSLVGAYLVVTNPSNSADFQGYTITGNTDKSITVNGTWSFSSPYQNAAFAVFVPFYLGAANYPFRRAYVLQGTGGGVRFGMGATAGGQNGLLFLNESTGRLQFRRPNGTIDTV